MHKYLKKNCVLVFLTQSARRLAGTQNADCDDEYDLFRLRRREIKLRDIEEKENFVSPERQEEIGLWPLAHLQNKAGIKKAFILHS